MHENQVTKHTKQEHQPHFYIQGVSTGCIYRVYLKCLDKFQD